MLETLKINILDDGVEYFTYPLVLRVTNEEIKLIFRQLEKYKLNNLKAKSHLVLMKLVFIYIYIYIYIIYIYMSQMLTSLRIPRVLPVVAHSVCSNLFTPIFSNKTNYVVFPCLTDFPFSSLHCNRSVAESVSQ